MWGSTFFRYLLYRIFGRSFSVYRFRSIVFDEDNTACTARHGTGGISVTLSIAFGSLFSLDVFGLSLSLHVFGLPFSMKIRRHRRSVAAGGWVTCCSIHCHFMIAFLSSCVFILVFISNFAGAAWGAADYVWHFRLSRSGQFSQFHGFHIFHSLITCRTSCGAWVSQHSFLNGLIGEAIAEASIHNFWTC